MYVSPSQPKPVLMWSTLPTVLSGTGKCCQLEAEACPCCSGSSSLSARHRPVIAAGQDQAPAGTCGRTSAGRKGGSYQYCPAGLERPACGFQLSEVREHHTALFHLCFLSFSFPRDHWSMVAELQARLVIFNSLFHIYI